MTAWTPYALEPIRQRLLWRRRIMALLLGILLLAALVAYLALQPAKVTETQISLSGGDNSQVEIALPGEPMRSRPLRVELSPGGITLAGAGAGPSPDRLSRASYEYPFIPNQYPYPFMQWVLGWGPLVFLGWMMWSAGRGATNPVAEVNFGIYKGAMPLEMITGTYRHLVVTQRTAEGPIFGKDREDFLAEAGLVAEPAEFTPVARP